MRRLLSCVSASLLGFFRNGWIWIHLKLKLPVCFKTIGLVRQDDAYSFSLSCPVVVANRTAK